MPVYVLTPVFDDWDLLPTLLSQLDRELAETNTVARMLIVDDGSHRLPEISVLGDIDLKAVETVEVLRLKRNLGHQRAIAIGLAHIHSLGDADVVVVMDGDGEDRPEDVPKLIQALKEDNQARIVFAARARRTEGVFFRAGYGVYRVLHRLLTGFGIRVGNFSAIPGRQLERLVATAEIWNHYAAAVFSTRVPYTTIPTHRGKRIAGRSRMNWISLVIHGLSALSVHGELVAVRALLFSATLTTLLVGVLVSGAVLRLALGLAVPDWLLLTAGLLVMLVLQASLATLIVVIPLLARRASLGFLPVRDFKLFVADCVRLAPQ